MKNLIKGSLSAAVVTALLAASPAFATNGYFKIGAGTKNRGMAGAGIAFGQDSMASVLNPAALAGMGSRLMSVSSCSSPIAKAR